MVSTTLVVQEICLASGSTVVYCDTQTTHERSLHTVSRFLRAKSYLMKTTERVNATLGERLQVLSVYVTMLDIYR